MPGLRSGDFIPQAGLSDTSGEFTFPPLPATQTPGVYDLFTTAHLMCSMTGVSKRFYAAAVRQRRGREEI